MPRRSPDISSEYHSDVFFFAEINIKKQQHMSVEIIRTVGKSYQRKADVITDSGSHIN